MEMMIMVMEYTMCEGQEWRVILFRLSEAALGKEVEKMHGRLYHISNLCQSLHVKATNPHHHMNEQYAL